MPRCGTRSNGGLANAVLLMRSPSSAGILVLRLAVHAY